MPAGAKRGTARPGEPDVIPSRPYRPSRQECQVSNDCVYKECKEIPQKVEDDPIAEMDAEYKAESKANDRRMKYYLRNKTIKTVQTYTSMLGGIHSVVLIFTDGSEVTACVEGWDFSQCKGGTRRTKK